VLPWSISIVAGTHVCLRQVRAKAMYDALSDHGVTHLCGAPIVMSALLNAPAAEKRQLAHAVQFFTAAAPPPAAVLAAMREAGFDVTHVYGLTEVYGPAVVNEWQAGLGRPAPGRLRRPQGAPGRALSWCWKPSTCSTRKPWSRCRRTAKPSAR
jgi:fatty-acyl-CoA synthase